MIYSDSERNSVKMPWPLRKVKTDNVIGTFWKIFESVSRQASKKVAILVMLHIFRLDFAFTPH